VAKEIVTKFTVGKNEGCDILKGKLGIGERQNYSNGSLRPTIRKLGNENINEIVWMWFVSGTARNFQMQDQWCRNRNVLNQILLYYKKQ
jgi:hypothetical protein